MGNFGLEGEDGGAGDVGWVGDDSTELVFER